MQQAGWLGHDHVHGRGEYCWWMGRFTGAFINGFSSWWWSTKHNTHHVYTNHVGIDSDIENDPVFHLFFPEQDQDVKYRRLQHIYFFPVASFLFVSWRIQSIQFAVAQRNYWELALMTVSYAWLCMLPISVVVCSILLSGFLVAVIVTASHQSEEMFSPSQYESDQYQFVRYQFGSTRDAKAENFFMEWLWGGMQYQLEHHLFPTMPRYYYAALAPRIMQFAQENGLSYRWDSVVDILVRNLRTLKHYAQHVDPLPINDVIQSSSNSSLTPSLPTHTS